MQTSHDGMDRLPENQQSLLKHAGAGYAGEPLPTRSKEDGRERVTGIQKVVKEGTGWSQGLREMQPLSSGSQQGGSCGNKHPTLISSKSLIP